MVSKNATFPLMTIFCILLLLINANAFLPLGHGTHRTKLICSNAITLPSHRQRIYYHLAPSPKVQWELSMSNFLDDVGKFFDDFGKNREDDSDGKKVEETSGLKEEEEGAYTGSTRIITIPAKTMKTGGLRLYCSLYLMGLQNTPEPQCWKAHQSDNFEVNLRYHDLTGSIIIQFSDIGITVDRLGSSPSMKYLVHESVILNGFLDELDAIVFDGDIVEENRLLTLPEPGDAIEKARKVVSFA